MSEAQFDVATLAAGPMSTFNPPDGTSSSNGGGPGGTYAIAQAMLSETTGIVCSRRWVTAWPHTDARCNVLTLNAGSAAPTVHSESTVDLYGPASNNGGTVQITRLSDTTGVVCATAQTGSVLGCFGFEVSGDILGL